MRLFEIIFLCLLALDALLLWSPGPGSKLFRLSLLVTFCVFAVHVFVEGPHWQMAPAYVAAMLFAGGVLPRSAAWRRWLAVVGLGLLPIAIVLCHILPMFRLPAPDGHYKVGTALFFLTDPHRLEDAAYGGGQREVVVQAWYPANCAHRHAAPYRRWKETTLTSSYQRVVWTNSCQNGAVATGGDPFPVLIFEPGLNGRRTQSTFLMEELASHGFVVFSLDHPYNSGPMELASGKVLQIPTPPPEPLSAIGFDGIYRIWDKEVVKQTLDTVFVLDTLKAWNEDPASMFHQRLDLDRIGALGHSLGGSVAAETAAVDPRIRAVFCMSAPLFATARKKGVPVPFFEITEPTVLLNPAQIARLDPNDRVEAQTDIADIGNLFWDLNRFGGYYAEMPGADHSSFTDKPIFSPYARLGGAPPKDALQRFEVIRQYAVAFFSQTLRSQNSPLLQQEPSPFAHVAFHHYLPSSSNQSVNAR